MKKGRMVLNLLFVIVAVGCFIFAFTYKGEAQADCEPTTMATTEETTEDVTEHTETEEPVTEPPILLYDVPLDVELQLHIINEADKAGIDPAIIFAMAFRESTYDTDCIGDNGESYGLLQVQPYWHYERMLKLGCTDLLNPYQNVTVAIDYLAEQIDRYDGNVAKALVAYNAGHYSGTVTDYALTVLAKTYELRGTTYVLHG
jgi:hypothetical protein